MFRKVICIVLVVSYLGIVLAEDEYGYKNSKIVSSENQADEKSYHFKFYTDYGIDREEKGELVPKGNEEVWTVDGKSRYRGDDGKIHTLVFEADENGYRPKVESHYEVVN